MVPKRFLSILVFGLPVLVVLFAVSVGGHALATEVSDSAGARGLWWVAIGVLVLLLSDLILLVGVLGIRALGGDADDNR